jgi:hypothetical protein
MENVITAADIVRNIRPENNPGNRLSDLELVAEERRLSYSCASFGGAMLLQAYRLEMDRRGLKKPTSAQ